MEDQGEYDRKPAAISAEPSLNDDEEGEEEATGEGDDDDWSRQVETDETTAHASALLLMTEDESSFRMESVAEEEVLGRTAEDGGDVGRLRTEGVVPPPPSHPELSLKERLVMRERQRRIETERARLKRQFIASGSHHGAGDEDNTAGSGDEDDGEETEPGRQFRVRDSDEVASLHNGTAGSVTEGTLGGESTRAHADDETREQLGFNMERFLRNSEVFNPQLEPTVEGRPTVMERFLNEPVVVEPEPLIEEALPLIVGADSRVRSFDADGISETDAVAYDDQPAVPAESFMSFGEGTNVSANTSINVEADDDDIAARDPLTPMASMDIPETGSDTVEEPRVLRLTEADMQEMAAIEEASIGNAPPSEREDEELSEIGELADFAGPSLTDPSGNFSLGTPTTAVESASLHSAGNQSARHASSAENDKSIDKQNLDEFLGELDEARSANMARQTLSAVGDDAAADQLYAEQPLIVEESFARMPTAESEDEQDRSSPPLVNRVLRPGMIKMKPHRLLRGDEQLHEPVVVDGFDFDKDAPMSPQTSMVASGNDSYRDLPLDAWSPAGKMHVSPIPSALPPTIEEGPGIPCIASDKIHVNRGLMDFAPPLKEPAEDTPLLGEVPQEVITSSSEFRSSGRSIRNRRFSIVSIGSIFSDVRSEEEISKEEIQNESEIYLASSMLARAFPERMFALTVTLIFEIPVLLMISGGSDALCQLVGRSRYQLLMGFIPLTSAISGNVGLQASTLTTRAISHTHVTPDSYLPWFIREIGAACILGTGMGLLLGTIAFIASGMDYAFGITILIAQFISIVTAGCTGTFAPLLFSFIFRRDSGKWGGPLETAIQDIVGSFAMVIISYHILKLLGPVSVSPGDVCSAAPTDDLA